MEKIESTYNKYKEGYKINEKIESTYNKYKEGYKLNGEDRVNIQYV